MTAVDTNVLIYACDKSDPRRQQIALELIGTVTDGVLLWQVACEFVAASRKLNDLSAPSSTAVGLGDSAVVGFQSDYRGGRYHHSRRLARVNSKDAGATTAVTECSGR